MRKLSLVIILLLCVLGGYSQVKETVLGEMFQDNRNGWPEDINESYSASVNSGTYYIEHKKGRGSKTFDVPTKLYLGTNYFIETRGKIVGGDPTNGFGIVWGKGKGGFLSYVITADGKFYVRKIRTGAEGEYLVKPTYSKYIRKSPAENTFRIQYSENEFMFFVNGHYLAHIPSEKYFGDNAGLILYGHQKVEVSNFGIYGTKNYEIIPNYSAKMRVSYYEIDDNTDYEGNRIGNGDCKIQPGETVRLSITFKNQSYGTCKDLNATIYAISDYVKIINQGAAQKLSNIERFHSQNLDLSFKVSKYCNLDNLKFKIDITDDKGRLGESTTFNVPMNSKIPPINKEEAGRISFTINLKEDNSEDINSFFPITLNNAQTTCAVVVGVEGYKSLPKATYATNDAKAVWNYLVKVINVPRQNIISVSNQSATLERVKSIFREGGELHNKTMQNADNIIVYFSGHGMVPYGKTAPYLMLFDSDPEMPQSSGYPLSTLLRNLKAMNPRTIICIFETSFAGVDRKGVSFLKNGGTVWNNAQFPAVTDNNTCMLYASGGQQCNPLEETSSHGLFTHLLLTALQTSGKNRTTLNMKTLYDYIYQRMDRIGLERNISVFPRIDCPNKDGIRLLK